MTRDDIIRMAREAGAFQHVFDTNPPWYGPMMFDDAALKRFAALVAIHAAAKEREWMQDINKRLIAEAVAAEREACAKVCEDMSGPIEIFNPKYVHYIDCAAAIRARGQE